ncbi:tandem-type lipoprotein [Staphylococcus pettenkoferi]|uniref:tandem-type lipoprotein n=1 Tax=Staphylococcus pettenkoferi TaxID=170573 RepID=UPI0011A37D47|nr:tandem-type lipoprotein [Staphylococcus pettenkoferi]
MEDLYDIEGTKNKDFKKGDKGRWIIHSSYAHKKDGWFIDEGMILYIDRNKRKTTGHYFIDKFNNDGDEDTNKYNVKLINGKLIPDSNIKSKTIKNKIKNFEFFGQYASPNADLKNKNGKYSYNTNSPYYKASFKLDNSDKMVKEIKKRYIIPYSTAKMTIEGDGKVKKEKIGDKKIDIEFKKNESYYMDALLFQSSGGK